MLYQQPCLLLNVQLFVIQLTTWLFKRGSSDVINVNYISINKVAKYTLGEPLNFRMKLMNGCVISSLKCNIKCIYSRKQKAKEKQEELCFVTQLISYCSYSSRFRVWMTIKVGLQCWPDLKNTHNDTKQAQPPRLRMPKNLFVCNVHKVTEPFLFCLHSYRSECLCPQAVNQY